jgi:nitrogen fixation NifU-like protein
MAANNYHYNETVLAHIADPHNSGIIEDTDCIGTGTNPACGDEVTLYLKFDGKFVADAKMEVLGCGAITASMSAVTDLVRGKTMDELLKITPENITDALGGLPQHKRHCARLAQRVIKSAVENRSSNQ